MANVLLSSLHRFEERFDAERVQPWMQDRWTLCWYANVVYLATIYFGRRWMEDKKPYSLRKWLAMWNAGLAAFSIIGFVKLFPIFYSGVHEHGFIHTACHRQLLLTRPAKLWGLLFVLSKVWEFGDTVFIVLRKTPLNFLHWYHHVSVCAYTAYTVSYMDPIAEWCGMVNLLVHAVMYSYYVLKSAGLRIPRAVAQCITILQLAQFGLGLIVLGVVYRQKSLGLSCESGDEVMWAGFLMYGSYMMLFGNFFYQRYIKR